MVDPHAGQDKNVAALLDWLSTFKGFYNKLTLLSANNAGRGLFAYSKALQPGEPMLVIPAQSLLNPLTLAASPLNTIPLELFPSATPSSPSSPGGIARLTTTQLLTLHLALARDPQKRHSSEWQIFIDSLPSFRPLHPLTWVVPDSDGPFDAWWPRLEESLSESVRIKIAAVKKRYVADLALLRRVLRTQEPFASQKMNEAISDETILWAWLNVNTRTVAMPLGLSEPPSEWPVNNHSFVPLLDMINHSSIPQVFCPKPEPLPSMSIVSKRPLRGGMRPSANMRLTPGKVDLVLFAPLRGLDEGEEVTFLYGPHSNAMLFAEYGFTEVDEVGDTWWPNGDVDVQPWLEAIWEAKGGTEAKRRVLEDAGMWGHARLAANGGEPQPSVGLMATLGVLFSPDDSVFTPTSLRASAFGRSAKLAARAELAAICAAVLSDAAECRSNVAALAGLAGADKNKAEALRTARALLREEEHITEGVRKLAAEGGAIAGF